MVSNSNSDLIQAHSGEPIGSGAPRRYARSADATARAGSIDASSDLLPLCVDLDGTLVRTDTLMEGMIALVGSASPSAIFAAFAASRSGFKARIAELAPCDPALLPYNETLLDYIRGERAKGRRIVLATAANEAVAAGVAAHLGLFDEVIASSANHNLKGAAKARALVERFGPAGFVYAGDAGADLAVWREAAAAIPVNVGRGVAAKVRSLGQTEHAIDDRQSRAAALLRAIRPHQWVKNLLVFVPIFTANAMGSSASWVGGILAFMAFCGVASSIYLVNDLLDLASDRAHPHKRNRPFAAGTAPLPAGIGLSLILLLAGVTFGWQAGILSIVLAYAAMSLAYSLWLKRQPLVDVFLLAGLYTVRLIGGGEATHHSLSLWLLAFASFLFLSLALIKRVAEVLDSAQRSTRAVSGRGYGPGDLMILELFGVCSTFASSLVLALYVQYETTGDRYASPALLWGIVPLVLLWSCRMWLSTTRGYMHHDPIMYAARDWVTWAIIGAMVAVVLAARAGMPLP